MAQNTFFLRNTIKDFNIEHPVELKQRSKRALSVATLRTNPAKFQHRQVFDTKLYEKTNFFKLDLQELKLKQQSKGFTPSKDLNKVVTILAQTLQQQTLHQIINNFNNHCALMTKNNVSKELVETVTSILVSLLRKISTKTEALTTAKKEAETKITQLENSMSALRLQAAKALQDVRGSRRGERQKQLRQANNQLDFNLKRQMLKVDSLQQKLREQGQIIQKMASQLQKMKAERDAQTNYRESMQYKVKRLKQELQVAHILKQQNLADKMKYIMNW